MHHFSDALSVDIYKHMHACVINFHYLGQMQCFHTNNSFRRTPLHVIPDVTSAFELR